MASSLSGAVSLRFDRRRHHRWRHRWWSCCRRSRWRGAGGAAAAAAAGGSAAAALANKLIHIFGKAGHNLKGVVSAFRTELAAYNDMLAAATAHLARTGQANGVVDIIVRMGGQDATVTGTVINGVVHIGTAYIP